MCIRLAALTVAGIMLAGAAFATTVGTRSTTTNAVECKQLFDLAKKTTEGNGIGGKAQDEVDRLLVQLQDQCNQNKFEQADQTAALIRGLVATE